MNSDNPGQSPGHNTKFTITVNGRQREVTDKKLTYLQVVQLAYPGEVPTDTIVFTVTYADPHGKDGSLVAGQEVETKNGMVFNVRKTDKS